MIALTSWFYAFWRCKNTKISENTQIFLVKILENTQIRRDGKQCKNTNNCLIREKVVTFRMVKLNMLLSIFLITK